jgi:hypothetical protein
MIVEEGRDEAVGILRRINENYSERCVVGKQAPHIIWGFDKHFDIWKWREAGGRKQEGRGQPKWKFIGSPGFYWIGQSCQKTGTAGILKANCGIVLALE